MKYLLFILPVFIWAWCIFHNVDKNYDDKRDRKLYVLYESIVRFGEVPYEYEIVVNCTKEFFYGYIKYSELYRRDCSPLNVHYAGDILGARVYVNKEVFVNGKPVEYTIGKQKRMKVME